MKSMSKVNKCVGVSVGDHTVHTTGSSDCVHDWGLFIVHEADGRREGAAHVAVFLAPMDLHLCLEGEGQTGTKTYLQQK